MTSIPHRRRVVGYRRVSKEEQALEGLSLHAQEQRLRAYAVANNLELSAILTDAGVSASVPLAARPQGAILLERVRERATDGVVAIRLDRLFRDTEDCLSMTRQWDQLGVSLHLIDLGGQALDTGSATGRFFLTMLAAVAEMERNLLRDRVQASLNWLTSEGIYFTAHVPYGLQRTFRTDDERRRTRVSADYTPHPVEGPLVREMFDRFLAGEGVQTICKWLNMEGHRGRQGAPWHGTSLRQLLNNPVLIGHMPGPKNGAPWYSVGRKAVNVEPLIPTSIWEGTRALFEARRTLRPKSRFSKAIFAGILRCGECGARICTYGQRRDVPQSWPDGLLIYYCCRQVRAGLCHQPGTTEPVLWRQVLPYLLDAIDPARVAERQAERSEKEERRAAELLAAQAGLDRLLAAYEANALTIDELVARRRPFDDAIATLGRPTLVLSPVPIPTLDRPELEAFLHTLNRADLHALLHHTFAEITLKDRLLAGPPILRG